MGHKNTKERKGGKEINKASSDDIELSEDDIARLQKSTKYERAELLDLYTKFKEDYPCGYVTKNDMIKQFKKNYPFNKVDKFCEYVFHAIDTNNNGQIDFCEYILAMSLQSGDVLEKKLQWYFNVYDLNRDGLLEKSELVKIIKAMRDYLGQDDNKMNRSLRNDEIDKRFNKLDKNGDGKVSKDEFIRACLNDESIRELLSLDVKIV